MAYSSLTKKLVQLSFLTSYFFSDLTERTFSEMVTAALISLAVTVSAFEISLDKTFGNWLLFFYIVEMAFAIECQC